MSTTVLDSDISGTTGKRWQVQENQLTPGGSYRKRLDGREDLRRVPKGRKARTYRVSDMTDKHHEVARLLLLGMNNKEIAKQAGITAEYVSTIRHSPVVKEQLGILRAARDRESVDVAIQIQDALPKCIEFLAETIESDEVSASLKSKNAFGLLSLGGHGPSKNISVKGVHAILTAEDIIDIRDRGLSLGAEMGIIEADVIKEERV